MLTLLAFGTLAFGGVYPWAYWPLAGSAAAFGAYGIIATRGVAGLPVSAGLAAALCMTLFTILLQAAPMSRRTLTLLSPRAAEVMSEYSVSFAAAETTTHTLSLNPDATLVTAVIFGALIIFLVGASRVFSVFNNAPLLPGMIALGLALAVVGIVQKPLYAGKIYGFWTPMGPGDPFGPFVNRNHFAGWMAMVVSLSLGYVCGRVAEAIPNVRSGRRNRIMWLASPEAGQILIASFAVVVMALAMVLTFSRIAISSLAVATLITGWAVVARQRGSRRIVLGGYLVLVVVISVGWGSVDLIATRFAAADWSQMYGRAGAWKDAWAIALHFMPFGSGMNTYGITTLFFQNHDLVVHYSQAHNDYLQVLAEGGLLVSVPAVAAIVLFIREIRHSFKDSHADTAYWVRIGAITGLVSIALQEAVDFSLQMPANALLFAIVAAIALHRPISDRAGIAPSSVRPTMAKYRRE